jgi:ketosteroid isomerase-like protein
MQTDLQKEIENENAKWAGAINSGNPEHLADLVTEDFVYLEPGSEPIEGRSGLVDQGRKWVESGAMNESLTLVRCHGNGDLLYQWATFSLDFPGSGGESIVTEKGSFVDIFRRDADGRIRRCLQMLSF